MNSIKNCKATYGDIIITSELSTALHPASRYAPSRLVAAVLCLGCLLGLGRAFPQPQQLQPQTLRSIQLGGSGGLRPVAPGNPGGPNFGSNFQGFGPQPQLQHQSQPPLQPLVLQRQPPQAYQSQQPLAQPQQLQPTYIQQRPNIQQVNTFPATPNPALGPRPLGQFPQPQTQLGVRSPQGTPAVAATEEEEYDDDEYEDTPAQQPLRGQPQQQLRPLAQPQPASRPQPQRSPVRIPQQQPEALGPSRFQVAQPQQQQQIRRPIQAQLPQQQPQTQQQIRLGQDTRLVNADRTSSTPAPVKTIDRYMRTNDDGSTAWGYTNEDGSFKEETIGVDCVVRGKYGYVDPDGVKREYEYQSGNPCDPNKRGQSDEEEEEEAEPGQQQQRLGGILAARPVQYQQPQFRQQQRPQLVQAQQ